MPALGGIPSLPGPSMNGSKGSNPEAAQLPPQGRLSALKRPGPGGNA